MERNAGRPLGTVQTSNTVGMRMLSWTQGIYVLTECVTVTINVQSSNFRSCESRVRSRAVNENKSFAKSAMNGWLDRIDTGC